MWIFRSLTVFAGLILSFSLFAGEISRDASSPGAVYSSKNINQEFGKIRLSVYITDGKTGKALVEKALSSGTFDYGNGLYVNRRFIEKDGLVYLRLDLFNQGKSQRWLHLKINAVPADSGETWFFDGVKLNKPCHVNAICRDENLALPLAIIGRKNSGFAWGLNPQTMLLSYVEQGADFSGKPKFWFGTKLVVNAGKSETLDLVMFGFKAKYGYLDAVQIYHDAFPGIFSVKRPGLNIDPRVTKGGCDYRVWIGNQPEEARRFGGGWEWCLRSFIHAGDYLGRNWEIGRTNGQKKWYNNKKTTRKKVNEWLVKQHAKHQRGGPADIAMMFYLAQSLTDAPSSKGNFKTPLADKLWPEAYAGHAGYYWCYSWGDNNYARNVMRDLCEIAGKLPISGFALDTARSPLKFFGKGIDDAPGRAYLPAPKKGAKKRFAILEDGTRVAVKDSKHGVYSRLDLATAQFIKFVHEMQKGRYNLGVVTNGCDWMEGFHTDSLLIEHTPNLHKDRVWIQRLIAGQKVMSWWDEFRIHSLIDWENLSKKEIRDSIAAFSRYVRLKSLVLAGMPMYRIVTGNEILFDAIPMLVKLSRAGWQAVPAFTADKNLWTARYGNGLDTFLVLCNPKGRDIDTVVNIDGDYFDKIPETFSSSWLFRDLSGDKLRGKAARKDGVKIKIPSAREKILKTSLLLRNPVDALDYQSSSMDGLNTLTLDFKLKSQHGKGLAFTAEQPEGFYLNEVSLNGSQVPCTRNNGFVISFDKAADLKLEYKSLYFDSPEKSFLDFEFVKNNKPAAKIVIPENPAKEEEYLAFRFQEYFRYYYEKTAKATVKLPIVRADTIPDSGNLIVIGKVAGKYAEFAPWKSPVRVRIGIKDNVLYVTALECFDSEMRKGTYRLFRALDKKYKYFGKMGNSRYEHPHEEKLYRKAGLIGNVLTAEDGGRK